MKKILVFSTAYLPFVGGAEVAIKEITDRLGDRYTFDLITARLDATLPDEERVGNIGVYRIGMGVPLLDKLLLLFWGTAKAFKLHKEKQYDLFWGVIITFASLVPYLMKSIKPGVNTPIVLTLQEGDSEGRLHLRWGGLIHLSWVLVLKRTQFLTAISTYLLDRAQRLGYKGPARIIPNGVSIEHFSKKFSERELHIFKQNIGKKDGDIYLVTTGRLVKKNASDTVIRALTQLPKHVHFLVLGVGPLKPTLEALAKAKHVGRRVHVMGFVGHDKLPGYLNVSDVFIRPSRSEGMGNSFVEAMAAGLPVIGTQEGGIADFLFDENRNPDRSMTGWVVDKNSPEQIARAVKDIIAHPDKVDEVRKTAKALVIGKYNWDIIARDMQESVFARVLPKQ